MTVKQTPVYNSANLAMFMVNVSHAVMHPLRTGWPECSVNDLKAWCRSRKYVVETLKLLPEMPDPILATHLRRDTLIPQWFQASKAAAASDGHAVHF